MLKKINTVLLLTGILLTTCTITALGKSLDQLYEAAIADARIAEPQEISRELTGISAPTDKNIPPRLIWKEINGLQHVLVSTWAGDYLSGKDWKKGETHKLSPTSNIWITACPELRNFFRDRGFWPETHEARILRIEQLLGLPRNNGKRSFIEFWVKPADLFRPSADPDPSDHGSQLEYPWKKSSFLLMQPGRKIHEYINTETPDREYTYQQWFENLNCTSYSAPTPYPWTRLGYTYDWGDDKYNNGHVGLSEFIVRGGSTIVIESTLLTEQMEKYFLKPLP